MTARGSLRQLRCWRRSGSPPSPRPPAAPGRSGSATRRTRDCGIPLTGGPSWPAAKTLVQGRLPDRTSRSQETKGPCADSAPAADPVVLLDRPQLLRPDPSSSAGLAYALVSGESGEESGRRVRFLLVRGGGVASHQIGPPSQDGHRYRRWRTRQYCRWLGRRSRRRLWIREVHTIHRDAWHGAKP